MRSSYVVMTTDAGGVVYPRSSWSVEPSSRGGLTPSGSPYRRIVDPRRLIPSSPLSSGQSSPEGGRGLREFSRGGQNRSRSLSPQDRSVFLPHDISHIPLHMTHTAVDSSDISSCGSRKSPHANSHSLEMMADDVRGRWVNSGMNGQNGALVTGEWRDEREALLMEILECQRRIQVYTCR